MSKEKFTINSILAFLIFLAVSSCGPSRNLTYFSDLKSTGNVNEKITNRTDPKIQTDDLLSITVSSLNPEANLLFNSGVLPSSGGGASAAPVGGKASEGYLVDNNGNINFPVLGAIKLAGLTKEQATDKMTTEIKHHIKDPTVNIRFLNFRVTVIGEVGRSSTFTIPTERVNIVEALALAGDMTTFGKRDNVLLIRESDGIRSTARVNLNDKALLNSPYYYLQQNDILYVEPVKIRQLQGGAGNFYLGITSAGLSIVSILIVLLKR